MYVVLITVFWAVMQTTPPIPRQATDNPANTADNAKKQTDTDKNQPTTPATVADPKQPPKQENAHETIKTDDTAQSIRVRELPAVSVKKDWTDYFYWGFSGLLAVVGVLQVLVLILQWKANKRQVQLQEIAMKQWVEVGQWRNELHYNSDGQGVTEITFQVINKTQLPLELQETSLTIRGRTQVTRQTYTLAPGYSYGFDFRQNLSASEVDVRQTSGLVFTVVGEIVFKDVLERIIPQPLSGLLQCGAQATVFNPMHIEIKQMEAEIYPQKP